MYIIPGPNNELVPAEPRDDTLRFPIEADHAVTSDTASFFQGFIESSSYSKYAETSSYSLGFIDSASYARMASTASYLSGSVSTAISSSYAVTSSFSNTSKSSSYSVTSSFANTSTSSSYSNSSSYSRNADTASYANVSQLWLQTSGGGSASLSSYVINNITGPTVIDTFDIYTGYSCKWLLSIHDNNNLKTSEILAVWNQSNFVVNFSEFTTNTIGIIPMAMSVDASAGMVRLISNPSSGTWTIKVIRFLL